MLWLIVLVSMLFRVVVSTNEVHIIQRNKTSVSYGKDQGANVYYNRPSRMPFIGITKIVLPVSNFDISLEWYEAYDKHKVPFEVDVVGFFRISDPVKAAQRISSYEDLKLQLANVVNGSIRKVLSGHEIIDIMESRNTISNEFTEEVEPQLANWWVESVKNVELMDLKDSQSHNSEVISNIMIRKTSEIERESRIEVANNQRDAKLTEIAAERQTNLERQEAEKQIGEKEAQKEQAIWLAQEKSKQQVQVEAKVTREKDMEVLKVEEVKRAEIEKEKAIIEANKAKEMKVIEADAQLVYVTKEAEGKRTQMEQEAEGKLIQMNKNAEGIKSEGEANAESKKLLELALIAGQIALADKIQNSPEYIQYLATIRTIEGGEKVGIAKAEALKSADLKVIANSWDVSWGVTNLMDLFSSKGGTALWGFLESFKNSEVGADIIKQVVNKEPKQTKKAKASTITQTDETVTIEA